MKKMNKFFVFVLCTALIISAVKAQQEAQPRKGLEDYVREVETAAAAAQSSSASTQTPQPTGTSSTPPPQVFKPTVSYQSEFVPSVPVAQVENERKGANNRIIRTRQSPSPVPIFQTISLPATVVTQPQVAAAPVPANPAVVVPVEPEPFDPNPRYHYGYGVSDPVSGDYHSATETRDGDLVRGQYSVLDPDGYLRIVTYTADSVNGFRASVERRPSPQTVVVSSKPIAAQPVVVP